MLITVGVFGPGDPVPVIDETVGVVTDDTRQGNSDVEIKLQHYKLSINVHKGHDIPAVGTLTRVVEPYVVVKHAGCTETTRVLRDSNPDWSASICIPAALPCHFDTVLLELWNGESNGTLMGTVVLDFFELIKTELQPQWYNLYWRPPTEGLLGAMTDIMQKPELRHATAYGGRLLISASAPKVMTAATKGVRFLRNTKEPPSIEYGWCADVYEVTSSAGAGEEVAVEVALGPNVLRTAPLQSNAMGSFVVEESVGRLDEMRVYLPGRHELPCLDGHALGCQGG